MVRRSGFARAQVLIVSPLINRGAISGMSTTVPTATSGMKAPAKPMSPRAFATICWRNGAQGARLVSSTTITYGSSRGRTLVIR